MNFDHISRRDFLTRASLAAGALALPRIGSAAPSIPLGKAEHCVFIWLGGGMSHIDTFDAKPTRGRKSNTSTLPSFSPRIVAAPELGWIVADAICSRVVLPAPFGPRTTQRSFGSTVQVTESRMLFPPRTTVRSESSSTGGMIVPDYASSSA